MSLINVLLMNIQTNYELSVVLHSKFSFSYFLYISICGLIFICNIGNLGTHISYKLNSEYFFPNFKKRVKIYLFQFKFVISVFFKVKIQTFFSEQNYPNPQIYGIFSSVYQFYPLPPSISIMQIFLQKLSSSVLRSHLQNFEWQDSLSKRV